MTTSLASGSTYLSSPSRNNTANSPTANLTSELPILTKTQTANMRFSIISIVALATAVMANPVPAEQTEAELDARAFDPNKVCW